MRTNRPCSSAAAGYPAEVRRNEHNVPSARDISVPRMKDRLSEVADWRRFVVRTITADGVKIEPGPRAKPPGDVASGC
jgi:hypothetical protein